jgi:hypothetical protein
LDTPVPVTFTANFDTESQLALFSFTPQLDTYWRIAPDPTHPERGKVLQLLRNGQVEPGKVRRPTTVALVKDDRWSDLELTVDLKCTTEVTNKGRDLVIVFCYQDPYHFYYAHLSNEQAGVHNVIMKVHGPLEDSRHTIHREKTEGLLTDLEYHRVKVTYDNKTGEIRVYVDNMYAPHLTAIDTEFHRQFRQYRVFRQPPPHRDQTSIEPGRQFTQSLQQGLLVIVITPDHRIVDGGAPIAVVTTVKEDSFALTRPVEAGLTEAP